MLTLYYWNGQTWTRQKPIIIKQTYVAYDYHRQQCTMYDPELLPLATPLIDSFQNFLILQMPISSVLHPMTEPPSTSSDLLEQLSTPPTDWAAPLWHRIRPLEPIDSLIQAIYNWITLIICSNASVDATKHSSCAWTIHGITTIWKGEGIVPGNCNDTYSG